MINQAYLLLGLSFDLELRNSTMRMHPFCSPNLLNGYKEYGNLVAQTPHDHYCRIRMKVNEEVMQNIAGGQAV